MVTNEQIKLRLRNKRDGILSEGYLVCDNCGGFYELQPGEKIEDFNCNCDCGGTLKYFKQNPYPPNNITEQEPTSTLAYVGYVSIIFFALASIVIGIILYRRGGNDKQHGILILIISSVLVLPVLLISMLIIYRTYM
ncbi:hypothetical protein Metbo_1902 [Methanobacterium lacus]|uniref:Uncharacterized protein n=1 Tax=Methanobacterium lacus (strain AL-21) TaxID=877455 RepID=F0TAQ0_METLA|nr:hypothetical protein [Methanobacterium lacus]ADZ10122.1 hypothetical protein Metbo_1902 [Methanobacterium lacus]